DQRPDFALVDRVADAGLAGVMLDTADKTSGGLRRHLDDAALGAFVQRAQARELIAGLAGSLGRGDIAPLLRLAPDCLRFRGAPCSNGRRGTIDEAAIRAVRAEMGLRQAKRAASAATAAAGAQRAAHSRASASPVNSPATST